jgi:hypothetical protein
MGVEALWKRWRDHVMEPETMGRFLTIGGLDRFFWYSSSIFWINFEY